MSNVVSPQVPIEVLKKGLKDVKIIEVSKELYRTIESFIASSSKDKYFWNTGIKHGDVIKFLKPDKWMLKVSLKPELYLESDKVTCPIRLLSLLNDSRISICFRYSPINNRIPHIMSLIEIYDINVHEYVEFTIPYELNSDLMATALYNSQVLFSFPIYLLDVLDRINHFVDINRYYEVLDNAVKEATAKTSEQAPQEQATC